MSKDAKNLLAPPDAKDSPTKARKMTQAILQDAEQEKEAYEFLEDDDVLIMQGAGNIGRLSRLLSDAESLEALS